METKTTIYNILEALSGQTITTNDTSLQQDLGLDSLQLVTLLLDLEESFGIELNESDMNPFELQTVTDVINLINRYCEDIL